MSDKKTDILDRKLQKLQDNKAKEDDGFDSLSDVSDEECASVRHKPHTTEETKLLNAQLMT